MLRWKNILGAIGMFSHDLSESRPRLYLLFAVLCACAGYFLLLLFPSLVFSSVHKLFILLGDGQGIAWAAAIIWLVVGTLAGLVCYGLYGFRPALPAGNVIDGATHPELHRLVLEQTGHYDGIHIDRIVLGSDFDIDIVKTPCCALPAGFTNTLVVGEPLLQCLSDTQFRCALARRLGQFSMRYNRLANWLYQRRGIWPQYRDAGHRMGIAYQPVAWLFRVYAPVYAMVTAPAARLDELAADRYAMELFSDEEVLDTITTQMVCDRYLREKYWPVVRRYAARNSRVLCRIHTGMASVLRAGLREESLAAWLAKTMTAADHYADPLPSLARRVDSLGFGGTRMGVLSAEPAAGLYLTKLSPEARER